MAGYLALCAMVLQPVDKLSDEETPEKPQEPKVKEPKPKSKVLPKKKPSPKPPKPVTESSGSQPSKLLKRPAVAEGKGPPMKKPAASMPSPPEQNRPLKVSKGLYKNGSYGFKVNDKQVMLVIWWHYSCDYCTCAGNSWSLRKPPSRQPQTTSPKTKPTR